MQGLVSSFDSVVKSGRIQSEDGHIYAFDSTSFLDPNDIKNVSVGIKCIFDVIADNTIEGIELVDIDIFNADKIKYKEPKEFVVSNSNVILGFDIIDRAKGAIVKGDRQVEYAKYRIIQEATRLGANALINLKVSKHVRNSFGFGFAYYSVSAIPCVVATPDKDGDVSARELLKKLDKNKLEKLYKSIENQAIAKIVLKILGAILIVIFTIGFFMSGL